MANLCQFLRVIDFYHKVSLASEQAACAAIQNARVPVRVGDHGLVAGR